LPVDWRARAFPKTIGAVRYRKGHVMKALWMLLALVAVPAYASDDVTVETFKARTIGQTSFNIYNSAFMFNTGLSGGQVSLGTSALRAHSDTHVYTGTTIKLKTEDLDQFSWPGVGAWVSGTGTITLQAYEFDEPSGMEIPLMAKSIVGGAEPFYLAVGSFDDPRHITSAVFSSDNEFAIDDLTLGIEGIGPGIPEPAGWTLMLGGFGLVGGVLRARRRAVVSFG
jgi:hypothetical protein